MIIRTACGMNLTRIVKVRQRLFYHLHEDQGSPVECSKLGCTQERTVDHL